MADHPQQHKYHFFVDGKRYETNEASLSGAQIKQLAGIAPEYQLFHEGEGNHPDIAISDGETVNLEHGNLHFFAVPPATFGSK